MSPLICLVSWTPSPHHKELGHAIGSPVFPIPFDTSTVVVPEGQAKPSGHMLKSASILAVELVQTNPGGQSSSTPSANGQNFPAAHSLQI